MNLEDGPRSLAMLLPFNIASDKPEELAYYSFYFHKLA